MATEIQPVEESPVLSPFSALLFIAVTVSAAYVSYDRGYTNTLRAHADSVNVESLAMYSH